MKDVYHSVDCTVGGDNPCTCAVGEFRNRIAALEAERDSQAQLIARLVEALKARGRGEHDPAVIDAVLAEAQALTKKQANEYHGPDYSPSPEEAVMMMGDDDASD